MFEKEPVTLFICV